MISTNRNTSNGEEGDGIELEPLMLDVVNDVAGADIGRDGGSGDLERAEAFSDEEAIRVVKNDVEGADIQRRLADTLLIIEDDEERADIQKSIKNTEEERIENASGRGNGCWDNLRWLMEKALKTIPLVILDILTSGAIIFDWVSVGIYFHQYWRDSETDHDPLYWCLGLPCLLSPGLLLLTLMPYYYILHKKPYMYIKNTSYYYSTMKEEFSAISLFGVFGLAALYPIFAIFSKSKRMIPFTIVEIVPQAVLRLIFNPYNWSTVVNWTVNISLISALLICLSLLILSTNIERQDSEDFDSEEKFSWEDWHEWMKTNAEVAINLENSGWRLEVCSCMRRFPVIKILVTVVLGLWPAWDIISDLYSVWDYYDRYKHGLVQALFWQLGLTFMFIPGLISLSLGIFCCCGGMKRRSCRELDMLAYILCSPIYPLAVIKNSLDTAVGTLRG